MIKEGIEFRIPCTSVKKEDPEEELLPRIERNEGAVYWLQPKGGTVDQQEACICVNGKFYALSCKFEKAIFRSVRLTRDFQNYECLVDGTRDAHDGRVRHTVCSSFCVSFLCGVW